MISINHKIKTTMKRILFFTFSTMLIISSIAQSNVSKSEFTPFQNQLPERIEVQLTTTSIPINSTNKPEPVHKTNYTYYGIVPNAGFAMTNIPDLTFMPTQSWQSPEFTYLFPDSLASRYQYDLGNTNNTFKYPNISSTGFVFDPYSYDFDVYGKQSLFMDENGVGYGYRLDTLWTYVNYLLPQGVLPTPDTLRFHIAYFDTRIKNGGSTAYNNLIRRESQGARRLLGYSLNPNVDYPNPIPQKGVGPVMRAENKITVDYILGEEDSVLALNSNAVGWRHLFIEIPGGYTVPIGSVLGVVAQYIPGFDYQNGDTLLVNTFNSNGSSGQQYIGGSIQHNVFGITKWILPDTTYDTRKYMYSQDQGGYNTFLYEGSGLRYATDTTDHGNGAYYESGINTAFWMSLSIEDEAFNNITAYEDEKIVNVFPNPTKDIILITIEGVNVENLEVHLFDISGKLLKTQCLTDNQTYLDISSLTHGLYFMRIQENNKLIKTVKVIKIE